MENSFKILPGVTPTPNGDVALLSWQGEVDSQIRLAIEKGEDLAHYSAIGYSGTAYGSLAWALFIVDTKTNFSNPRADLFYFDLVLNPSELKTAPTLKRWQKCLYTQDQLKLEIPYSSTNSRLTVLLRGQQLQQYVDLLQRAIGEWQPNNNYVLAVQSLDFHQILKQGIDHINSTYRSHKPQQKLLINFANSCINELPPNHPLRDYAEQEKLNSLNQALESKLAILPSPGDALNKLLVNTDSDAADNLVRDFRFAAACLQPEGRSTPMIAVGLTDTGKWFWRKIPFEGDIDTLWYYSRAYRALLGYRQWQSLIDPLDVPIPDVSLANIHALGRVPNLKQFQEAGRILKLAVLQKQFGISTRSTIVVGKKGFDEVTFYPLDRESRCCLFKIILESNNRGGHNLCVFGQLDAALGTISAVGISKTPQTQKPLSLLLFLTALAYRDLVVAREQLEIPNNTILNNTKHKKQQKPKHSRASSLPLLARIKRTKSELSEQFADPHRFVEQLSQVAPHLRTEHLRELPLGHQPSDRQRELAETYGFLLPEGFTFVSPTIVGQKEIAEPKDIYKQFRSLSLLHLLFT